MLSENIRIIRKSEGLSREGMSVPDAGLRIALSGVLETPVSTLLGVTTIELTPDDLQTLCTKLERIHAHKVRPHHTHSRPHRNLPDMEKTLTPL